MRDSEKLLSSFGTRKELHWRRGYGKQRIPRGTTLGNYRVDELIGVGGFGEVYQAHNLTIAQAVAVKVCFVDDKAALAAFTRGASLLAQLKHPNVIILHDFFLQGSLAVAVMELLDPLSTLRRVVGDFVTPAGVKSVLP
jgi:serine/threonine protein kinase